MGRVIAIDFDGTITQGDRFPDIGPPNEAVVAKMRERKAAGDTIIIWTCRQDWKLAAVREYLTAHNIPYDYINENDPERISAFGNDCRKIGADLYVDDKAMRPEEWVKSV